MAARIWRAHTAAGTRPTPVPIPGNGTVRTASAIGAPA